MPANADFSKIAGFLRAAEDMARPGSRALTDFRRDLRTIALEGAEKALLSGLGPGGTPTAPLKASTLKRGRPGNGPPRVPRNRTSRMFEGLNATWESGGGEASQVLIVVVQGVPFAKYLIGGTEHMAARPMGIHPDAMRRVGERLGRLMDDLRKFGGGR